MTSKLNIFNALPAAHHSEDEDEFTTTASDNKTKEKRVRTRGKKQEGDVQPTRNAVGGINGRDHKLKEASNDLDNPHRLDRKSGTGVSAFDKKEKKEGRGKGNWGNFKDDNRRVRDDADAVPEVELAVGEEEDRTITLDEYLGNKGASQANRAVNDVKAKISDEQLKKELGKATLLATRKTIKNDDKQETHKKSEASAITGMNTEHAELLGFRTGFKVYDDTKKRDFNKERRDRPQRTKDGEEVPATEETKPAEQTEQTEQTEQVAETQQPVEGAQTTDAQATSPAQQHRGENRGARRGGNRGARRGGDRREGQGERREYQGERREHQGERREHQGERREHQGERREYQGQRREHQGERREHQGERREHQGERKEYQGERKEYQGPKGGNRVSNKATKGFSVEDESAFPKLG